VSSRHGSGRPDAPSGATIVSRAEITHLLDDLSTMLDDDIDLDVGFGLVVAGWRAAVDDPVTVSIAVYHDDGSTALVLTDTADAAASRAAGDVASTLSIPLAAAGGLAAVLRLGASAPLAFKPLRTDIGPLLAAGGPVPVDTRDRAAAGRQHPGPADMLALEALRNQAIGVLLHGHGGSPEHASARLGALADSRIQSVAEVAAELVATAGDGPSTPGAHSSPDTTVGP
jgi:hypothetical protein